MNSNYTSILADYAAGMQYEDIPGPVINRAKQIMLDGIGCALFGSSLPWSNIITNVLRSFESGGKAGIWGTGYYASAPHAALANGTAMHAFELDDLTPYLHTAAVTLPPALAVARHRGGVSGRLLLTAIVAGSEVAHRISVCMGAEPRRRGFHHPSIYGVLGAGAAAGRVAGLSDLEMADCFSHAASLAAGLMGVQYGGMMKRALLGRASQTGVYAALLAKEGFTGTKDILEREYGGFCTSFASSARDFDMSKLVQGLGERYYTTGVEFKAYSCRGPIHTSLDSIRKLRGEGYPLAPEEIERVRVRVPGWVKEVVGWPYVPDDVTSAQLNLSYGVAVMLLEGDAFVDQYTEEKIRSPQIMDMIGRIEVVHDPALDAAGNKHSFSSITEIVLKSGQKVDIRLEKPNGCSDVDLVNKFRRLAGKVADDRRVEKIAQQVNSMETLKDVSVLDETLALSPTATDS